MNISFHVGEAQAVISGAASTGLVLGGLYFLASGHSKSGIWVAENDTTLSRYAFGPGSDVSVGNISGLSFNYYTATRNASSDYYTLTDQEGNSISSLPVDREFIIKFSATNTSTAPKLVSTSGPTIRWDVIGVAAGVALTASALSTSTFYKCARRYSTSYVQIYPYSGTTDKRQVSTGALYGALKANSANIVSALPTSPTANQIYFVT